jgi:16S rRNA (uracil1498-N3)-methyltransferase
VRHHRFYVVPEQVHADTVIFSQEQAHQLRSVLRLRPGDTISVFDGVERLDRVVVLTGPHSGRIESSADQPAEPATRLVVYPALLPRDKFEHVLQKVTEIGAAAVVPVLTARALVREPPDEQRQIRWRAILREAAEQSGRGVVPKLEEALPLQQAIERAVTAGVAVMAYEGERHNRLKDALLNATGKTVSVFVGPEGGYAPEEADCASRAGAHLISLGPRILRTETASPVLAALVLYELDERA